MGSRKDLVVVRALDLQLLPHELFQLGNSKETVVFTADDVLVVADGCCSLESVLLRSQEVSFAVH
jgi:hypothetical protein